jgi:hypothetical protein
MSDVNISKFRAQVVRDGSKPATPGFVVSEGQSPTDPAGSGQNHLPVTIAAASTGLAITESQILGGAGTVAQYIRGDGSLADFPATTGGGSSVSYYLNGSVSQGTIGGVAYLELNRMPIFGAGTDITRNSDGYIASFITDAGDPNKLEIPAGNWNLETYFSASSGGGNPSFYVELYKYNGSTFTLIATSSGTPELIAFGTNINPYFSTLAVPQTTLALTDRLALRYYVTTSGRTITLHTENNHLCQVITTFTTGLTALNGLTTQVQFFAVGTSGTDFNIASSVDTHTFNLPTASGTNRGALSSTDWTTFNNKENAITAGTTEQYFRGDKTFQTLNTSVVPELTNLYYTEARVNANTNVAANTAARHNAVTIGTANGLSLSTQVLSLGLASAGVTGALSGTDWSTFNSKQNALTNPVTGTGTTNFLPKFTGSTTIGDSVIADNATEINIPKRIFLNSGGQSIFFTPNLSSASNRIEGSSGVPLEIFTSGSELRFAAGGVSTQVTLLSSGNVGIGTTSPGERFTVNGYVGLQRSGTQIWHYGVDFSNSLEFVRSGIATRMTLSSDGNLLVGTTTDAGFKLDVNGTGRFSGNLEIVKSSNPYLIINDSGVASTGGVLFQPTGFNAKGGLTLNFATAEQRLFTGEGGNTYFQTFYTNGVERLRITATGNVGIGTASPTATLNICSLNSLNSDTIAQVITRSELKIQYRLDDLSSMYFGGLGSQRGYIQGVNNAENGGADISINPYGGNLLVGTTTDNGARLQVNGFSRFDRGTLQFTLNPSYAGGNVYSQLQSTGDLALASGGDNNRLYITSGGNVGIGTTSPDVFGRFYTQTLGLSSSGSTAIQINGGSGGYGQIDFGAAGVRTAGISASANETQWGSVTAIPAIIYTNGSERMRITSGGEVLIGTTTNSATSGVGNKFVSNGRLYSVSSLSDNTQESLSMYSTGAANYRFYVGWGGTIYATSTSISGISDISLKTNIRDLEKGLTDILKLKPRKFDWKNGDGINNIGFIAQEIEKVFPELISEYKYNEYTTKKSLKMGDLIPSLVKAIQELKQEIDTLKN